LNNTPLNDIVVPSGDVSLNSHKITNLSPASSLTDAMILANSLRYQWCYTWLVSDISEGLTNTYMLALS